MMKLWSPTIPSCNSRRGARWPEDIPVSERRFWQPRSSGFTAIWRIHPGTIVDDLQVKLPRHFVAMAVLTGGLTVRYEASGLRLGEGMGVAVSSPEIQVSVPCNPLGDTVVELHLFCRSRAGKEVVRPLSRFFLDGIGAEAPGIFGYAEARGLASGRLFGNEHMTIGHWSKICLSGASSRP